MIALTLLLNSTLLLNGALPNASTAAPQESDYYTIETLVAPPGVQLEVGGIAFLPDGRPIVCTRRGYVYVVEGAYGPAEDVRYIEWAQGLQEPLGLLVHGDWIYCTQRGELSRMRDVDGDDRVDVIETLSDAWSISGNYHEYAFGPRMGPDGRLWITTNKPFGGEPFGRVDWRGYSLSFDLETGEMTPVACGLRSPAGIEAAPWGDMFYTDNQGEWCGASKLSQIEAGDFHGHPYGTFSTKLEGWEYDVIDNVPDGVLMPEMPAIIPSYKLPAVWFPYDKMGKSPAGMVWDQSDGKLGPFAGQLFVGDQFNAWVMRVSLEQVNGHWQGACYRFRDEFLSGITRVAQAADGSLFAGMTNRGWGSRGRGEFGLQRMRWTGKSPFEIYTMEAQPDGFLLNLTHPVDPGSVTPASFRFESYTYELHSAYGSAEMDRQTPTVTSVRVGDDGKSVHLVVEGLRLGYVHELHAAGLRSAKGLPLLHPEAYYTLINLPE
ncbi:MAG: glucose/arabinose dehydrogenase [Planctomycetota bacterium]|jgi:glucose/arabinose dehydrogenase